MPQMSACIGSIELALSSRAKRPASRARPIQALRSPTVRMVWYLVRSTGSLRAASLRASASEIGVPLKLEALSDLSPGLAVAPPPALALSLPPPLAGEGRVGASKVASRSTPSARGTGEELLLVPSAATSDASICEYSATRLVSDENSIAFRKAI